MKKHFVLLMLLLSAFVLASCGQNKIDKNFEDLTNEVLESTEVIKIKFRVVSGTISDGLADLLAEFKDEYPKIEVELDAVSGGYEELRRLTILDIQNSRAPQMVIGYPDHFAEYYSGDAVTNLDYLINGKNGYTEAELKDFVPSYLAEGKGFDDADKEALYSLPFNKSTEVMIYNKTMFEELKKYDAGIVVPKTWQEVKTVSEKINAVVAAGKIDDFAESLGIETVLKTPSEYLADNIFAPISYDSTANAFITISRQWDGKYTERAKNDQGYALFDNANTKAGLKYFQDEATAGRFAVAETFNASYASDAFIALKTLMTIGSSAGVNYNSPKGGEFELGVTEIPYNADNANNKYVIQQGTNIAILSQSTNLQRSAAWLLMKFLLEPANSAKFAMATGGYLPVRLSSYESAEYKEYLTNPPLDKKYLSEGANVALSYIDKGYKFFIDDAFIGSSAIRTEVAATFSSIIVNKSDINNRVKQAYDTLGKAFQK
jgi:multiple sugar transport system substrate-binding protein